MWKFRWLIFVWLVQSKLGKVFYGQTLTNCVVCPPSPLLTFCSILQWDKFNGGPISRTISVTFWRWCSTLISNIYQGEKLNVHTDMDKGVHLTRADFSLKTHLQLKAWIQTLQCGHLSTTVAAGNQSTQGTELIGYINPFIFLPSMHFQLSLEYSCHMAIVIH